MIDIGELRKEFEDFWSSQNRPMTGIEAAWAFVEEYNLNVDPTDLIEVNDD